MHKVNIGVIIALVIFVILNIVQFILWHNANEKISEQYTAEIANLEQTIAGYGTETTVYTVTSAVKAGDQITADNIEPMKMYSSLMTAQFVTNTSDIIGGYFKVAVNPGTPITYNMTMEEELDDTMRDHDIILDSIPVGTTVGDYIDIRMTMPYGDDYIVISHKRIYGISDGTIKLYMTELEWNTYEGALIDYFLNQEYGCTLYGTRYIEPGIQQDAVAYYAVPTNIAALLSKNPNIVDKEEAVSLNEWRESIEELLVIFRDEDDTVDSDGSKLAAGRSTMNEAIESDRQNKADSDAEAAEAEADSDYTDEITDDFWDEDITDGGGSDGN
jgi:hypothetical protein